MQVLLSWQCTKGRLYSHYYSSSKCVETFIVYQLLLTANVLPGTAKDMFSGRGGCIAHLYSVDCIYVYHLDEEGERIELYDRFQMGLLPDFLSYMSSWLK